MTTFLLALTLFGAFEPRGEGFALTGLPLGSFIGEVTLERFADEEVRLELRPSQNHTQPHVQNQYTVSLSFWPEAVGIGRKEEVWRARGYSRLEPDGVTQRLELRRADTHLIFLDNVERGTDLVVGWTLERIDSQEVELSFNGENGESRGLELAPASKPTFTSLNGGWCARLLGVSPPPKPSPGYAEEITEPKVDLFIMRCQR